MLKLMSVQILLFLIISLSLFRKLKMPDTVSVVVPVEGSPNKVMALIGRKICLVDRETGAQ